MPKKLFRSFHSRLPLIFSSIFIVGFLSLGSLNRFWVSGSDVVVQNLPFYGDADVVVEELRDKAIELGMELDNSCKIIYLGLRTYFQPTPLPGSYVEKVVSAAPGDCPLSNDLYDFFINEFGPPASSGPNITVVVADTPITMSPTGGGGGDSGNPIQPPVPVEDSDPVDSIPDPVVDDTPPQEPEIVYIQDSVDDSEPDEQDPLVPLILPDSTEKEEVDSVQENPIVDPDDVSDAETQPEEEPIDNFGQGDEISDQVTPQVIIKEIVDESEEVYFNAAPVVVPGVESLPNVEIVRDNKNDRDFLRTIQRLYAKRIADKLDASQPTVRHDLEQEITPFNKTLKQDFSKVYITVKKDYIKDIEKIDQILRLKFGTGILDITYPFYSLNLKDTLLITLNPEDPFVNERVIQEFLDTMLVEHVQTAHTGFIFKNKVVSPSNGKKYPLRTASSGVGDTLSQRYLEYIGKSKKQELCQDPPKPVKIAVIDNGYDMNHPDLIENIYDAYDVADDDDNAQVGAVDPAWSHGTVSAGIIGATHDNDMGIDGVYGKAELILVKATGDDDHGADITAGLESIAKAVDMGADVINLSRGGDVNIPLLQRVTKNASEKGVTIVASAGNYDNPNPFYPAAYQRVIGVAAVDENGQRAEFSNYGDWVDVAAPGTDILSTDLGNTYAAYDGTSESAPITAAAIGLAKGYGLGRADIQQMLKPTDVAGIGDGVLDVSGLCEYIQENAPTETLHGSAHYNVAKIAQRLGIGIGVIAVLGGVYWMGGRRGEE